MKLAREEKSSSAKRLRIDKQFFIEICSARVRSKQLSGSELISDLFWNKAKLWRSNDDRQYTIVT